MITLEKEVRDDDLGGIIYSVRVHTACCKDTFDVLVTDDGEYLDLTTMEECSKVHKNQILNLLKKRDSKTKSS